MTAREDSRDRWLRALHGAVKKRLGALQTWRRDLHRHAEAGWTEFRTSGLVADELVRRGYRVLRGRECVRPDAILGAPLATELEHRRREAGKLAADMELPGVVGVLERGARAERSGRKGRQGLWRKTSRSV